MTSTVEHAPASTAARLHDPSVRGFASDNYSGVHPEVLAALAAANEGHQVSYGEDDYTARLAAADGGALRRGNRVLPGLQRHRRERPVAAVPAAALGSGHLCLHGPHPHGRERRPGAGWRHQTAAGRHHGRQAHPGADRQGGLGMGRRAPRPAAGRLHHADHGAGHLLHAGRSPGHRGTCPFQGHETAYGRCPAG